MTFRILYALQGFPPNQNGGTEWETYRRAQWLLDAGHSVSVVAVDQVGPEVPEQVVCANDSVSGIPVTRVSLRRNPGWGDLREFDDPRIFDAMVRAIDSFRPDVVHVLSGFRTTTAAIRVGRARGVPVVLTAMDFWLLCPRVTLQKGTGELCDAPDDLLECVTCLANDWRRYRLPHRFTGGVSSSLLRTVWRRKALRPPRIAGIHSMVEGRRRAISTALRDADSIIAASRFLAGTIAPRVVSPARVVVMRQGVDSERWRPAEIEPRAALHVGFVGQIAAHKGLFDLIQAFQRVTSSRTDVRLFIHGDHEGAWPATRDRLYRAVEGRSNIRLMGRFENTDIRRVHANLDVLVVPSRWYENSPNVILEAFACGTPVVAADLGGMAELVAEGAGGWLMPAGDVNALAEHLQRLAADRSLLDGARAAIPPVRTIDEEMRELVTHYERIGVGR